MLYVKTIHLGAEILELFILAMILRGIHGLLHGDARVYRDWNEAGYISTRSVEYCNYGDDTIWSSCV